MTDPSCANCRFGVYTERRDASAVVVCRRFPPFPIAVVGERFGPGDTVQGYWPRVGPGDECGEHKFHDGES